MKSNVAEIMRKKGISWNELKEKSGVHFATIALARDEPEKLTIKSAIRICEGLEETLFDVFIKNNIDK